MTLPPTTRWQAVEQVREALLENGYPDPDTVPCPVAALALLADLADAAERALAGGARMPASDPPIVPDELSDLRAVLARVRAGTTEETT